MPDLRTAAIRYETPRWLINSRQTARGIDLSATINAAVVSAKVADDLWRDSTPRRSHRESPPLEKIAKF